MYLDHELGPGSRSVPLAELRDINHCIGWIGRNLFGTEGAKWARIHVQGQKISRSDHLLRDLGAIWPGTLFIAEALPFEFASRFLDPAFIEMAPKDRIIEYSYHLAVGRPPDPPGLRHYENQLVDKRRSTRVINDILLSEEARNSSRRKILSRSELSHLKSEIRKNSAMMFFKKPRSIEPNFFNRPGNSVAANETKCEWHFVYKDANRNHLILSPGINLVGEFDQDARLKCGTDWILYGPKSRLSAGKYDIAIEMDAPADFRYHLDASHGGGLHRVVDMKLKGPLNIKLSFENSEDIDGFEIRLLNLTGRSELIDIKHISIKQL